MTSRVTTPVYALTIATLLLIVCLGTARQADNVTSGPQNGCCEYSTWRRPGTVTLLVLAGVHEADRGRCGNISRQTFTLLVALDWILSIVNGNRSHMEPVVPGITIGYEVYDTCDNEDVTTDMLYSGIRAGLPFTCSTTSTPVAQPYIGALLLTDVETSGTAARLLEPMAVLRPLPASPALSNANHDNLLQTAPRFRDEMEVLLQLLVKNTWNFIALVSTDDMYGTSGSQAFKSLALERGICVNFHHVQKCKSAEVDDIGKSSHIIISQIYTDIGRAYGNSIAVVYMGQGNGAVSLLMEAGDQAPPLGAKISWVFTSVVGKDRRVVEALGQFDDITAFTVDKSYLDSEEFNEYFTGILDQTIPSNFGTMITEYKSMTSSVDYVSNVVEAVLSLTSALRDLHNRTCGTTDGMCPTLESSIHEEILREIQSATINIGETFLAEQLPDTYIQDKQLLFSDDGHIDISGEFVLEVFKFQMSKLTFSSVGTYGDGIVNFTSTLVSVPTSACNLPADCVVCRNVLDVKYSYTHGDVLLLGLFSLRQYGSSPYTCGEFRRGTHDVITVSSFMQSISAMRTESGIKFGGIAIDDCYSAFNTSSFLADLFSGRNVITNPENGEVIDVNKVFVIVGALSSPVSIVIADQATALGIPMISYGASSPELANRLRYPYFLRTVPSDRQQVRGMVTLIASLNVSHIGIIYIDDTYGQNGLQELMTVAKTYNICVEEPLAVQQQMDNASLKDVIQKIYETQARIVIYFSIDSIAVRVLDILATYFNDKDPLVFIASEAWGTNQNLIEGKLGEKAKGSLVFNIDTLTQIDTKYKSHLHNLTSEPMLSNRWIPRFFEDVYNCDFMGSFDKTRIDSRGHGRMCDQNDPMALPTSTVDNLYEDQRGIHVVHAVNAAVSGFKDFAPTVCKRATVCDALRSGARGLVNAIKQVQLQGSDGRFNPFTVNGEGNIGYSIYNIQRRGSGIEYVKVGIYSRDGELQIASPAVFYDDRDAVDTLANIYGFEMECTNFCKDDETCRVSVTAPSTTTPAIVPTPQGSTDSKTTLLVTTIVFGTLASVMVLAVSVIAVLCWRHTHPSPAEKSDTNTSHDTSSTHTRFSLGSSSIYDVPSHVSNERRIGHHVRSSSNPTTSALVDKRHGSLSSLPINYSDIKHVTKHKALNQRISQRSVHSAGHGVPVFGGSPSISGLSRQSSDSRPSNQPYKIMQHIKSSPAVVYRNNRDSSPRFRYPSAANTAASIDSHCTFIAMDTDSDIFHRDSPASTTYRDDGDTVFGTETTHNTDSYPAQGYARESSSTNTRVPTDDAITYVTANDLMIREEEEEGVEEENDAPMTPAADSYIHPGNAFVINGTDGDSNVLSPDSEVADILFSSNDQNVFGRSTDSLTLKPSKESGIHSLAIFNNKSSSSPKREFETREEDSDGGPTQSKESAGASRQPRVNARSVLADVPDIIRHGAYAIDEEEVFII